jgi:hypothetical protein
MTDYRIEGGILFVGTTRVATVLPGELARIVVQRLIEDAEAGLEAKARITSLEMERDDLAAKNREQREKIHRFDEITESFGRTQSSLQVQLDEAIAQRDAFGQKAHQLQEKLSEARLLATTAVDHLETVLSSDSDMPSHDADEAAASSFIDDARAALEAP